jgi:DNA-binding NarL/FixJ family response regulator
MTTVLVVCDVRIYREGLAEALGRAGRFEVVGASRDVVEATTLIRESAPEVVLLDMAMPDSLDAVGAITEAAPDSGLVALAVPETERGIIACAEAGVVGYVSRDASIGDLCEAVASAARGEVMCPPRFAASLVHELARRAMGQPHWGIGPRLTARESEVVDLIDQGLSNKEIARALHISLSTVKNHVHNVLEKCHVHRRLDAVGTVRPGRRTPAAETPVDLGI